MNPEWIDRTLEKMTLEEKVGQIIMVGFYNLSEQTFPEIKQKILQYHLGGIFHFNGSQYFFADCFHKIQQDAKIPLLIASDYEMGPGWMIKEGMRLPRPMARGYRVDEQLEYEIATNIAVQAKAVGTNIIFSPVVDVNTHHLCPDVNVRAYSDDVESVAKLSLAFTNGLQDHGVMATAKHFPGNGGTAMDQHISAAIIPYSKTEMKEICLEPYRQVINKANVGAVMVAHLEVPALCDELHPKTGRPVPASVSKEIITDLLKDELGFKGMVVTDALNMGGINSQYTRTEANIKTLIAGTDLLLNFHPENFELDFNAICEAVKTEKISEIRLNSAVRKVLTAKSKLGLDNSKGLPLTKSEREKIFIAEKYNQFSQSIAEQAITVVRNQDNILPIKDINGKKVCVFDIFSPENEVLVNQGQFAMPEIITERLIQRGAIVESFEVTSAWSIGQVGEVVDKTLQYDYVFVNFFVIPSFAIGTLIPNINAVRLFFKGILTTAKKIIITAFGDPYIMFYCQAAPVYVCTFDESVHTQEAAIKAWFGEIPITGKMPVTFEGFFKRGDGITL